jgi:hypothetical protein
MGSGARSQSVEPPERLVRLFQEALYGFQPHRWIGREWRRHERPDGLVAVGLHDVPAQSRALIISCRHKFLSLGFYLRKDMLFSFRYPAQIQAVAAPNPGSTTTASPGRNDLASAPPPVSFPTASAPCPPPALPRAPWWTRALTRAVAGQRRTGRAERLRLWEPAAH